MAESEVVLLKKFSTRADADAFAELVRRYVQLVYSTSWRVLHDEGHAADVTQETFFELTRQAGQISGSLGSWFHKVATRKSIDLIRRRASRRRRERTYAQKRPETSYTWHDLSGYVDEALDSLDESARSLLLEHFLLGKTTSEIAQERGTSQATVSRRLHDGLEQLRAALRRQGLLVGVVSLSTMLMENTSEAVPATVLSGLTKITTAGTTTVAVGHGWAATLAANADLAKVLVATVAVGGIITVAGYMRSRPSPQVQQPPAQVRNTGGVSSTEAPDHTPRLVAAAPPTADAAAEAAADPPAPAKADPMVWPALRPLDRPARGGVGFASAWPLSVGQAVYRSVAETGVADLSSPETAVYSLVALAELEEVDQLGQCLAEGAEPFAGFPALVCLGYPVETIGTTFDGENGTFTWRTTVHKPFPLDGVGWLLGDALTLTAQVVQADDSWKVLSITPVTEEESP